MLNNFPTQTYKTVCNKLKKTEINIQLILLMDNIYSTYNK